MKSLFKYLLPNNDGVICQKHKQYVIKICCSQSCTKQNKHLICENDQCIQQHRNHNQIAFGVFKQICGYIEKEIMYKKQIKVNLASYKQQILKSVNLIFQRAQKGIDEFLDKRYSSKFLIEIQKKFKYEQNFQDIKKMQFYRQFISNFSKIQTVNTRKFASEEIINRIKKNQKRSIKSLNFQFLGLDESILPNQELNQIREYSKQQKLKKILPFKCQLNLKFRASQHKYLTNKLYSVDIRGPIVLLVQSYKNRVFGGYSPVMFPKTEQYIEDNKLQCFLFSLDDKCLLPLKEQYKQYSIRGGKNFWFGRGDLAISDECQKGNISWAQIGRAYKAPTLAYGNESYWLAGAWYYRVVEYEIYEVDIQSIK